MLIQFILSAVLLCYFVYAQLQRRTSSFTSLFTTVTSVVGIVLVWNPSLASTLANAVGVGRGTDLVVYLFIAVAAFVSLYLHLRVEASLHLLTDLARAVALQNPQRPKP